MPRWLRVLLIVLGSAGLLAVGLASLVWWQANAIVDELQAGPKKTVVEAVERELDRAPQRPRVPKRPLVADLDEREPDPPRTILLVGSDRRWDQRTEVKSDTIVLVRVQPAERRIALLSIPRDLLVEVPGRGLARINEAFEQGPALLTRTVRETFGVEIDHYVEVNFGGFRQLVEALGGVYLPIDQRYFNENRGTPGTNFAEIDLQPGYQRLSGKEALAFVRYRHGDSDLVRAARQQLFLRETMRQVFASKYDVLKMRSLLRAFAKATTSDIDDVGELWRLVDAARSTPAQRVVRLTVPARETMRWGAYYVEASPQALERTVRRWAGEPPPQRDAPKQAKAAPRPKPPAAPKPPALRDDGGEGRALVSRFGSVAACVPTRLPPGYWWPERAARSYRLDGEPSVAAYATKGSGRSVLWTWTRWDDPPVLDAPTSTLERGGRDYELWFENRRLRQIAWREDGVRIWITNTLRNELTIRQMVALAQSCR